MTSGRVRDRGLLLSLGLVTVVTTTVFLVLARAVTSKSGVVIFDKALSDLLLAFGSPRWRGISEGITWFGEAIPLATAAVLVGLVLIAKRLYLPAFWWAASQAGAGVLVRVLKRVFERPRPDFAYIHDLATSFSFPSGHAVRTFAFCAMGAWLVFRFARSRRTSLVLAPIALVVAVVMSFTRVYLGAHYLSDVVGGMIIATAWVALCVAGMEISMDSERRS